MEARKGDGGARPRRAAAIAVWRGNWSSGLSGRTQQIAVAHPESNDPWRWDVGWVNDGLGPGDGQQLIVHFGTDGRVTRATLTYPSD